jgi:hypothetical protein
MLMKGHPSELFKSLSVSDWAQESVLLNSAEDANTLVVFRIGSVRK